LARDGPRSFYGLAGDAVRLLEPHTEADPVGLLLLFLALYGNCVGIGPCIYIGATRHPARLFAVQVGATARARKDTARAEIYRLFSIVDPEWAKERQVRGLGSGEGLTEKVKDKKDAPPPSSGQASTPVSDDEQGLVTDCGATDAFSEDDDSVIERGWKSLQPDLDIDKRYRGGGD
jgi:hypothetical protein